MLIANKLEQNPVSSFEQLTLEVLNNLSIGEPEHCACRKVYEGSIRTLQLWLPLQDKLVMGSDVRQVLTHVEMGNADYGIVYASDAFVSDKVTVVAEADPVYAFPDRLSGSGCERI